MALVPTKTPWTDTFNKLRTRGQQTLMAVLAPEETGAETTLNGDALARHHIAKALDALREPGQSKPQTFAKLRLLLNAYEQGRSPAPLVTQPQTPLISRRARLMSRAFQGAASWRNREN